MNTNNIDNNLLKDSLLNLNNVSAMIKESVAGASKELINESIKEMMSKLIIESDSDSEDCDDEEEVKDTFSDTDEPAEDTEDDDESGFDNGTSDESDEESEDEVEGEWGEFDKYRVGEREYDFRSADEADLQGVYSILRNDDNIEVRQDGEDVYKVDNGETEFIVIPTGPSNACEDGECYDDECEDGECGPKDFEDDEESVFTVELGDNEAEPNDTAEDDVEDDDMESLNDETENKIQESKIMRNTIFEIALNEDDNLGYGMKQTKPAFTTPTDSSWDGGDTDEWDDGVPHGENRPDVEKKATPFESSVKENRRRFGRRINEDVYGDFDNTEVWDELPEDEGPNAPDEEEVTPFTDGIGGPLKENSTLVKQPYRIGLAPENAVDRRKVAQRAPRQAKAKVPAKTSPEGYADDELKESIIRRTNKIMNENKALRSALNKFEKNLNEASVANVNLQNIVRLVTENTTSASEKKSIREKFAKVKTVAESNMLYNTIKESINKANTKGLNEAVAKKAQPISAKPAPTAEKVIYKSNDLKESLDLMSRMNKVML